MFAWFKSLGFLWALKIANIMATKIFGISLDYWYNFKIANIFLAGIILPHLFTYYFGSKIFWNYNRMRIFTDSCVWNFLLLYMLFPCFHNHFEKDMSSVVLTELKCLQWWALCRFSVIVNNLNNECNHACSEECMLVWKHNVVWIFTEGILSFYLKLSNFMVWFWQFAFNAWFRLCILARNR